MGQFVDEGRRPQVVKAVLRFVLGADRDPTPYLTGKQQCTQVSVVRPRLAWLHVP